MVLASLVGTMTIFSAMLLLLEGGAMGTAVPGWAVNQPNWAQLIEPTEPLQGKSWNYIIIYESGDLSASADSLADGFVGGNPPQVRPQADFHFVIDSAHSGAGTMDGALQVGTSWRSQTPGAPFAEWPDPRSNTITPYNNAVGVCLAGDLTRKPISEAQHRSLLRLVQELQKRFNIPSKCVLFQWDAELGTQHASPAQKSYAESFRAALGS